MRTVSMIVLLLLTTAAPCLADDPLESLNTVEETLSQLAHYRATHSSSQVASSTQSQPAPTGATATSGEPGAEPAPPSEGGASCCQDQPR